MFDSAYKIWDVSGPVTKRFLKFFLIGDSCWEWIGSLNKQGYGRFSVFKNRVVSAHRIAYQIFKGKKDLDFLDVLHKCDNPKCVNPAHLYLGEDKANTDDRMIRERHNFKLNPEIAREIIEKYKTGLYTQKQLSSEYHVNQSQISRITTKQRWEDYT